MVQEDIYARMTAVEVKVDDHEKKLAKQEEKNDSQIEMNTLLKMQIEVNKEQNQQMKLFGETLTKVNENLTGLNTGMHDLNTRVTEIENNQESKKIDPAALFKDIVYKVLPSLILAFLIFYFGWK